MSPLLIVFILLGYFLILLGISFITSRTATSETFFTAHRQSPWYVVAFGMIGTSLSGITFISVPGSVGQVGFSYFQVVLGYLVGYWVIMLLLMPLFYRLRVTSIYVYLDQRFGTTAHKTGAFFFLLSRTVGSSVRLFLAASVLHMFIFQAWGLPFYVTVIITLLLIWVYTFRGGIKTIVWTDTLQTSFLVLTVGICMVIITRRLDLSFGEMVQRVWISDLSQIFFYDVNSRLFFPKQFFGGVFIAIAMTGLDQDMMQKNLTCKSLSDARKNMFWFSLTLMLVNLLFLALGALLFIYSEARGILIPDVSDEVFPMLALNEFGTVAGLCFLLGIIAAAYSSADSALAALTTSFCIDFLGFKGKAEALKQKQKNRVHLGFCVLFLLVILVFKEVNEFSLINAVLVLAGYTYGPLLGMYAFGLFTKSQVREAWVPVVCVASPILSYMLKLGLEKGLEGYEVGLEVLALNGFLTFCGFLIIAKKQPSDQKFTG